MFSFILISDSRAKVEAKCQNKDYGDMLALQERKVKSLQDQKGVYANQTLIYEEFIKQLKKKSCCPLCDRDFAESAEEKELEEKLRSEIRRNPEKLKDCERELKIEQTRYDALQQLKPVTERITELENVKLPKLG